MKRYKLAPIAEPTRPSLRQRLETTRGAAAQTLRRKGSAEPLPQAATARAVGPDAELLRLEAEWLQIRAAEDASYERQERIAGTGEHLGPAPKDLEAWKAWYAESIRWRITSGIEAEEEDSTRLCGEAYDLSAQVARIPAVSLAGVQVKARLLLYFASIQCDSPKGLLEGLGGDLARLCNDSMPSEPAGGPTATGEASVRVDLSGLTISQLACLYDRFVQAADFWNDTLHAPWANDSEGAWLRDVNAVGQVVEVEQERACRLRDAVAHAIKDRDLPDDQNSQDLQLEARIRHELLCNGSLRHAPTLIMDITESWGASA